MLNRTIALNSGGIVLEADTRHAKEMVKSLKLGECKGTNIPLPIESENEERQQTVCDLDEVDRADDDIEYAEACAQVLELSGCHEQSTDPRSKQSATQ